MNRCINPKCGAEIKEEPPRTWDGYEGKVFCKKCLRLSIFTRLMIFKKAMEEKRKECNYHYKSLKFL